MPDATAAAARLFGFLRPAGRSSPRTLMPAPPRPPGRDFALQLDRYGGQAAAADVDARPHFEKVALGVVVRVHRVPRVPHDDVDEPLPAGQPAPAQNSRATSPPAGSKETWCASNGSVRPRSCRRAGRRAAPYGSSGRSIPCRRRPGRTTARCGRQRRTAGDLVGQSGGGRCRYGDVGEAHDPVLSRRAISRGLAVRRRRSPAGPR